MGGGRGGGRGRRPARDGARSPTGGADASVFPGQLFPRPGDLERFGAWEREATVAGQVEAGPNLVTLPRKRDEPEGMSRTGTWRGKAAHAGRPWAH